MHRRRDQWTLLMIGVVEFLVLAVVLLSFPKLV